MVSKVNNNLLLGWNLLKMNLRHSKLHKTFKRFRMAIVWKKRKLINLLMRTCIILWDFWTMCQVSGIRFHVKTLKTFILKIFQEKLQTYKHIFYHTHIFFMQLSKCNCSIWGTDFERLIYNRLFEFFIENELISSNQSGFKHGDSCVNQLLSITHEINPLMMDMKSEVFFLIYQRHLIRFGKIDSFIN